MLVHLTLRTDTCNRQAVGNRSWEEEKLRTEVFLHAAVESGKPGMAGISRPELWDLLRSNTLETVKLLRSLLEFKCWGLEACGTCQ